MNLTFVAGPRAALAAALLFCGLVLSPASPAILKAFAQEENKHVIVRLIGALAFRTHCPA